MKENIQGVGLGLRRGFMEELSSPLPIGKIDFFEVAPENWIGVGGKFAKLLDKFVERFPIVVHGLSLSLGSPAGLNLDLVKKVKRFCQDKKIKIYTEHLSWCSDESQLFDLLPIPFTEEAAKYTADRINQVQDILGQRIAIENASYYIAPGQVLDEIDFLNEVLTRSDCLLLFDINNVYVNSVNNKYDPKEFIDSIPQHRIAYAHIAGHWRKKKNLIIDTHGDDVIEPVWNLLDYAYSKFGVFPTMLERDFDFPPINSLLKEVARIKKIQIKYKEKICSTLMK